MTVTRFLELVAARSPVDHPDVYVDAHDIPRHQFVRLHLVRHFGHGYPPEEATYAEIAGWDETDVDRLMTRLLAKHPGSSPT